VNGFQHRNQQEDAHEDPETQFIITIPGEVVGKLHSFRVNKTHTIQEKMKTHLSEQNALQHEINASAHKLSR
jgi:hypothetical protein